MFPFYPYEQGIAPGGTFCVFDVPKVGRFGVSICYDLWFPEVARSLAFLGAEAVFTPSLTNTIDREVELSLARANAAANQSYVVNVNGAGDLGFGRSIVCGPGGEIAHACGSGREIFALELDLDYVARVRERGWNGLGQTLKSIRDSKISFPPYEQGARAPAWDALGALKKPESGII
jgi:predicted amidohydrolase